MADWRRAPLGEVFEVQLGKMLGAGSQHGQQFPYLANRNVQWGRIVIDELGTMNFTAHERDRYRLESGDLLVCEGGEVGRSALWPDGLPECYFQNAIHRLRATAGSDPRFMRHFFEYATTNGSLRPLTGQTSIAHLPRAKLVRWAVPVPPLEEQWRIAEILDTIDETIQASERVIAKLWSARTGLLRDLLVAIDSLYETVPLMEMISLPSGQADPRREPFRSMTLVAPDHLVGGGRGRLLARETAEQQGAISGKYRFETGDVLYSKIRPELRKAWLADTEGLCSADMYPLKPVDELNCGYLAQVVLGDRFSRFAVSVSGRSSGMPKINREELAEFELAVPPLTVQVSVSRIAEASLRRIDYETAGLEKLRQVRSGLAADLLSGRVRTVAA